MILPLNLIIGVLQLRLTLMRLCMTQFWSNLKILYWSVLQPSEQIVKTTVETSSLADDYVLMLGGECCCSGWWQTPVPFHGMDLWSGSPMRPVGLEQRNEHGAHESDKICNYCHKRGH